ncbi:MAG: ABC transporter ATP-binding protein [Phycisphaeraceae bacterium]|nr:ABC transporter ATP-binding protein [Phycisphaeraceae bacterium]
MSGASTAPKPLLAAEDVCFGYQADQPLLEKVSLTLAPGRVTALIGPNAAGKSTLIRILLGQLSPWQGVVRLGGRDIAGLAPPQRARWLSYVPQRGGCGFAFTVRQVVTMGRHALPYLPGAVEEALGACDLLGVQEKVFAQLSIGQQQLVLLARAMAQAADREGPGAKAMLLDEPASAMDPWHVHRTMGLLAEQTRRGMGVLIVLHDLNLTARYADDVWILHEGRLIAAGPWDKVLRPEVLEPVYRVRLTPLIQSPGKRPLFAVEPADTLEAASGGESPG